MALEAARRSWSSEAHYGCPRLHSRFSDLGTRGGTGHLGSFQQVLPSHPGAFSIQRLRIAAGAGTLRGACALVHPVTRHGGGLLRQPA